MRKSFFVHNFVKSWSIYIKPRPKWSQAHSTHIHCVQKMWVGVFFWTQCSQVHFSSENVSFLWYLSVIIRECRMSQRPSGRTPRIRLVLGMTSSKLTEKVTRHGIGLDLGLKWRASATFSTTAKIAKQRWTPSRWWLISVINYIICRRVGLG